MNSTKYIVFGTALLLASCSGASKTGEVANETSGTGSENGALVSETSNGVTESGSVQNETLGATDERGENDSESITDEVSMYGNISLPSLAQQEITGSDLVLEEILSQNEVYTRYRISYKNGDTSLSGIMNIPNGEGPYPLIVMNHGYIDTSVYTNGRGLKREQDYMARNGFAVIHPDYRNHALSDKISTEPYDFRQGYTTDVIAAVLAVQNSELEELINVNASKVGMLGHSMGAGITQNVLVIRPELVQAAILYGPVSNAEYDNFERYQIGNRSRSSLVQNVVSTYQTPDENPSFWDGVSSRTFFNYVQAPVMIFTGTADADTPTQWAESIYTNLQDLEKRSEIVRFEGEGHEFGPRFGDFMQQSRDFFNTNL